MFLKKYISKQYLDLIFSNYSEDFLNILDEKSFKKIYNLFKSYGFYFIKDIILNYLEIFDMEYDDVNSGIIKLKEKLGEDFINLIGNNMIYLEELYNY